ncbi:MAG TPA: glycosyltransferase family 2 protein [Rectinema sp.]|nr:glycosyltransferase family 2 protein [Rectinema sp.]
MSTKHSDNRPLVSIITVVLNAERFIERCVKSVIAQTYKNIEYIVIDGGSTDRTLKILEKYRDKIDILISEKDNGVYDAMNKGYRISHGDYIIMLNSDDFFIPEAIELSVNAIREQKADYCGAQAYIIDKDSSIKYVYWPNCFDKSAYIAQNPCAHETLLVSRKAYDDIGGYNTKYKIAADLKFELELISRGYVVAKVEQPILYFTDGGMSSNEEAARKELVEILADYLPIPRDYIEGLILLVNKGIPSENCIKALSDQTILRVLPIEVISYLLVNIYYKYMKELNKHTEKTFFEKLVSKLRIMLKW